MLPFFSYDYSNTELKCNSIGLCFSSEKNVLFDHPGNVFDFYCFCLLKMDYNIKKIRLGTGISAH